MFVDLHNHLLPGIDDGAPTMGHAVEMARIAVRCGTGVAAATPHLAYRTRRTAPPDWLREQVRRLQQMLDLEGVALRVVPGVEIPLSDGVASALLSGELVTLGDSGAWALVEPPFGPLAPDALSQIESIIAAGFGVLLAHPERSSGIQTDMHFLPECAARGVVFQLTSGSILGRFGSRPEATAEAILRQAPHWPIIIASDSHDLRERSPGLMALARDSAAAIVGPEEAEAMVSSRPAALLAATGSAAPPPPR